MVSQELVGRRVHDWSAFSDLLVRMDPEDGRIGQCRSFGTHAQDADDYEDYDSDMEVVEDNYGI